MRPADTMVPAGSSLELYCIPQGPGPASITWYKDDVAVQQQSKGDGQVLVIRGTTASDGGTYTCSVSDGFLTVNASAAVTVVGKSFGAEERYTSYYVCIYLVHRCLFVHVCVMNRERMEECNEGRGFPRLQSSIEVILSQGMHSSFFIKRILALLGSAGCSCSNVLTQGRSPSKE